MAFTIHTSNPKEVVQFEWYFENFSFMPKVFRGPAFHPLSNYNEAWSIEFEFGVREMKVFLMRCRSDPILNRATVKAYFSFHEVLNPVHFCYAESLQAAVIEGDFIDLKVSGNFSEGCFRSLPDDKLIVKAKLTIAGHNIHNSVNVSPTLPALTM